MDRGWYSRFGIVMVALVLAVCSFWGTADNWIRLPGFLENSGVASSLVAASDFVKGAFKGRISPGLDIQGGIRLMYEVEVDDAIKNRRDRAAETLLERMGSRLGVFEEDEAPTREQLDKVRGRVKIKRSGERSIVVNFEKSGDAAKLDHDFIKETFPELRETERAGNRVVLSLRDDQLDEIRSNAVKQVQHVIAIRIDELGLREATVSARGDDLIVEVPGQGEETFGQIRSIISRTAKLEFKLLDDQGSFVADVSEVPDGIERLTEAAPIGVGPSGQEQRGVSSYFVARGPDSRAQLEAFVATLSVPDDHHLAIGRTEGEEDSEGSKPGEAWRTYYLYDLADVTGEDIKDAYVSFDGQQAGQPVVAINFNAAGAKKFERVTERNVKRRFAIVLDDRVESAPRINERIGGGRAQITMGGYGDQETVFQEASDLSLVLRAGALPAPIRPVNEQLIGATLGQDSVQRGARGALVGILLVLVFMLFYYQVAGVVADSMVILNLLFLMAILCAFDATLTLPGVVGIALTVGMAVDANVLITERIREELRLGKSPRSAVDQGFRRAFWSIFDSQVTTFIAGVILFQYGTGPIKGFAVTLMVGILTSLFTGIFCSKVFFDWIVRGLRVQRLRVG